MAHDVTRSLACPIVMIGMMGAGKTRTGKALASALALPFIDNDQEIEAACGCTIAEYFTHKGEESFRKLELETIKRLLDGPPKVIAAGGGTVINPVARTLLKEKAIAVWLQAEPSVLAQRCAGNDARPLLQGSDAQDILSKLLEQRHAWYADVAKITVRSDMDGPKNTVEAIVSSLCEFLKKS